MKECHINMYKVVITGSSKGIGYALAQKFLEEGDYVVLNGRNTTALGAAQKELQQRFPTTKVYAFVADITKETEVQALANFAVTQMGEVNIWVNNAGISGYLSAPLSEFPTEKIEQIIATNVFGTLLCVKIATKTIICKSVPLA